MTNHARQRLELAGLLTIGIGFIKSQALTGDVELLRLVSFTR